MEEIWKPIAGYQDYEVSNLGRVRSWRIKGSTTKPVTSPRLLKFSMCGSNRKYRGVKLYRNNKGTSRRVHRLVLETFVGPMPEGFECLHNDGDATNNRLANLRYGTHKENMDDQKAHGTAVNPKGESHGMSVLTETDVLELRCRHASGTVTQKALATEYGVDPSTISLIILRKKWRHI